MGREIKRVPVDFDAPLDKVWAGFVAPDDAEYDEDAGDYVGWTPTEPPTGDGWQVWETVSEGSPITPVFPTAEALVEHLATVGTTWDQKSYGPRGPRGPWRREAAEAFVAQGWAPSMVAIGHNVYDGARDADVLAR